MKAMLLTGHGGPEMLRYGDAPDPTPAPDEIVVDVHAASINAADYKVRLGVRGYNLQFPHILGVTSQVWLPRLVEASPISPSATRSSASWTPGLKVRMQKSSSSGPRSSPVSLIACLICKPLRWL